MADLLKPDDLRKISDDIEMAKAKQALARMKDEQQEKSQLLEAFMEKDLHPEVKARVNAAIRRAAEQGNRQIQVMTFPASYCNDSGRKINNLESDWPTTLEGFAKKAYEFYMAELKPLGYRLTVQVLDYPGGMPGNVGMFLSWGG
ncbi:MAG TPA: hypothetical protein VMT54_01330 [Candidatus Cybelea sp.]|nr:hypothetical protein [Candidatus Cybelea sp.]